MFPLDTPTNNRVSEGGRSTAAKNMEFIPAVKSAFANYATFKGRASRSEYWWFVLFTVLANMAMSILDSAFGASDIDGDFGLFGGLFALAIILPSLALASRRLHDLDYTFWWYLLAFTGIGIIVLFIWACMKGTPGPNRYGPDPLAGETPPSDAPVQPTPH